MSKAQQTDREFWAQWQKDNHAANKARHARQATAIKNLVANGTIKAGSRDSSGNSIETLIKALERASK